MTLREIFTSTAEGATTVTNWFLDTDIFVLVGMFMALVISPYYAFTLLRAKETKKKVVGGFFVFITLFSYWGFITILIE